MRGLTDAGFRSDEWGLYTRLHRDQTLRRATALREKYAARVVGRATVREAPEFVVGDTHPLGCAFLPNIR